MKQSNVTFRKSYFDKNSFERIFLRNSDQMNRTLWACRRKNKTGRGKKGEGISLECTEPPLRPSHALVPHKRRRHYLLAKLATLPLSDSLSPSLAFSLSHSLSLSLPLSHSLAPLPLSGLVGKHISSIFFLSPKRSSVERVSVSAAFRFESFRCTGERDEVEAAEASEREPNLQRQVIDGHRKSTKTLFEVEATPMPETEFFIRYDSFLLTVLT